MMRALAQLSALFSIIFLVQQCSGATTPMTMALTYPSRENLAKIQGLAHVTGIDLICAGNTYVVFATITPVVGAPAYDTVCWNGAYFSSATVALTARPLDVSNIPAAFQEISDFCGAAGIYPAYVYATTTAVESFYQEPNGLIQVISQADLALLNNFVCQFRFIAAVSACAPITSPGLAYAVAQWGSEPLGIDWFTLCNTMFTDDPYVTGTFVNIASHPVSYSILRTLFETCTVPSFLLNQPQPDFDYILNMVSYFPPFPIPSPYDPFNTAFWAICSYAARPCTVDAGGWFMGSIYPALATQSWSTFCNGYLKTRSIGVFREPSPEEEINLSVVYAQCPFGTSSIYTANRGTSSSYIYGWCSYSPLQFSYSTMPPITTTTTTSLTSTSTRILVSKTLTESFTFFTFSTTFLVTSTSITTTATSTIVKTSPSTTTTTTTTTSTSVRVISDSTTSTLTTSLTFTNSITTRSTGSFTETVKTSLQTTITRFITRTYCEPSQTTTTLTTSQVRTLTETDVDTVYVDITVYTTISKTRPTSDDCPQSTKTRTKCATSTQIECKTSVVFQRPDANDNQCPPIEAVVCNQGPSGILVLFNNFPYDLAVCPCQAVGKSMLVLREDTDFMDTYAAVVKCGGSMGRAWAVVAQDYTRCYIVCGDGSVRPASSCDEPLPVLCR